MKDAFSGTKQVGVGKSRGPAFSAYKKEHTGAGQKKILPKDGSGKQLAQFGKLLASRAYWYQK